MNELKPCPFCGSENAAPYSVKSCHSVLCTACGGEGPEADSEDGAIAAWNRRHEMAHSMAYRVAAQVWTPTSTPKQGEGE